MVLNVQKMVGTLTIFHLGIDRRSRTFVLRVGVKGACPLFKKIRLIDSIFLSQTAKPARSLQTRFFLMGMGFYPSYQSITNRETLSLDYEIFV